MTKLQTLRSPTLLILLLHTRRKGQGPKAKPADKIQESSSHHRVRKSMLSVLDSRLYVRKSMLSVLENGISRIHTRDGMLANFQVRIMVNHQTRQIATTTTTCFRKIDADILQKTQGNPVQPSQ